MEKNNIKIPGPKQLPILGNLLSIGSDILQFVETCYEKYGPVVRIRLEKDRDTYLISDPEYIEYVLVNTNRLFAKGYQRDKILQLVLGNGLITSEGDFWLKQRRLSQPAFHQQRIEKYSTIMIDFTERMLESWEHGQVRDIHQDIFQLAMEIVGKSLFDVDLHQSNQDSYQVGKALNRLSNEYISQYTSVLRRLLEMLPFSSLLPHGKKLIEALHNLDKVIYDIIKERKKEAIDHGDLLSMLLAAQDDEGKGMSDQQLRDEVMTIFLAGHETTTVTLSWTSYLLAQNPHVEEKLLTELRNVLGGRSPSIHDIPKLTYTQYVIKEVMRVYPPVWFISREALQDVTIGDYQLPKGCEIGISQWIMHRNPKYFENPLSFIPERWENDLEKKLPKFVYFPFGAGPRVCIGNNFAMMEAVLLLSTIIQRFHFVLDENHPVIPEPSVTVRPKHGIHVRLEAR